MTPKQKMKTAVFVIGGQIFFGNLVFLLMDQDAFADLSKISPLIYSTNISCVLIFSVYFWKIKFHEFSSLRLFLYSLLCCFLVVFVSSVFMTVISSQIGSGDFDLSHLPGFLFMIFMSTFIGSFAFFPAIFGLALVSFIVQFLRIKKWERKYIDIENIKNYNNE